MQVQISIDLVFWQYDRGDVPRQSDPCNGLVGLESSASGDGVPVVHAETAVQDSALSTVSEAVNVESDSRYRAGAGYKKKVSASSFPYGYGVAGAQVARFIRGPSS